MRPERKKIDVADTDRSGIDFVGDGVYCGFSLRIL